MVIVLCGMFCTQKFILIVMIAISSEGSEEVRKYKRPILVHSVSRGGRYVVQGYVRMSVWVRKPWN